jgi:lysophospholipase L1-like esterase
VNAARRKHALFATVSVLAGIVVALVVAEIVLRVFDIGYGTAPLESDPVLHHVHPRSYEFRVHQVSGEYGGHLVRYDEQGRTCDPDHPAVDASRAAYRVAFLGDSYVEATQVPYADSFVGRLQAGAPNAALRNYGVSSYSPLFYLVQWRTEIAAFHPTHVFVMIFSNDVDSDADMIGRAVRDDNGDIMAIPGPGGGKLVRLLRKLYVVRLVRRAELQVRWWLLHNPHEKAYVVGGYVEENPDISALTSSLVKTLAREVAQSGARFVLLAVPSRYRLAHPDEEYDEPQHAKKWQAWARANGIEFVDLVESFRESQESGAPPFLSVDGHFNATGHALVAEAIRRAYPDVFGSNGR